MRQPGQRLSAGLQVVVELLRLGLQALEFLLNEVSQGFAHLHLRGRTGAHLQPSRSFAQEPWEAKGAGRGQGQPGDILGTLTVDLFSARSRSSTGRTLKGFPINTVIFCRGNRPPDDSNRENAHSPSPTAPGSQKQSPAPNLLGAPSGHSPSFGRGSMVSKGHPGPRVHALDVPSCPNPKDHPCRGLISFALLVQGLVPGRPSQCSTWSLCCSLKLSSS